MLMVMDLSIQSMIAQTLAAPQHKTRPDAPMVTVMDGQMLVTNSLTKGLNGQTLIVMDLETTQVD